MFLYFDPSTLLGPKLYFDFFSQTLLRPKLYFDLYVLTNKKSRVDKRSKYRTRSKRVEVKSSKYRKGRRYENGRSKEKVELMRTHFSIPPNLVLSNKARANSSDIQYIIYSVLSSTKNAPFSLNRKNLNFTESNFGVYFVKKILRCTNLTS